MGPAGRTSAAIVTHAHPETSSTHHCHLPKPAGECRIWRAQPEVRLRAAAATAAQRRRRGVPSIPELRTPIRLLDRASFGAPKRLAERMPPRRRDAHPACSLRRTYGLQRPADAREVRHGSWHVGCDTWKVPNRPEPKRVLAATAARHSQLELGRTAMWSVCLSHPSDHDTSLIMIMRRPS